MCADAVAGAAAAAGVGSGSDGRVASSVPRTVTVLWYPEDYPPVTNHLELVRMLEEVTEPYGFKVNGVLHMPNVVHLGTANPAIPKGFPHTAAWSCCACWKSLQNHIASS